MSQSEIVLGLDASTTACSVALLRDGLPLAHRFRVMGRGQSEALMPMVAEAMAEAGLSFDQLTLIGVTVGPGAFTGLRIGLAAARGMALALKIPVAGVTTAATLAAAVPLAERRSEGIRTLLVAIESKRAEPYVQAFDPDLTPRGEVEAISLEEAKARWGEESGLLLAGDGAALLSGILSQARLSDCLPQPDAASVASLAAAHWRLGQALPPRPLYLRPPDVTLPKPRAPRRDPS